MKASDIADRYYTVVRARDIDGFTALFADDALFIGPFGHEARGVQAIRDMELAVFNSELPPFPTPVNMIRGEGAVAAEVQVATPDGTVHLCASFFYLNEQGLIQSLIIYRRDEVRS